MRVFPGEREEGELLAERPEKTSEQKRCRARERGAGRRAGCEEAAAAAAGGGHGRGYISARILLLVWSGTYRLGQRRPWMTEQAGRAGHVRARPRVPISLSRARSAGWKSVKDKRNVLCI
jgi:hypothetical protein